MKNLEFELFASGECDIIQSESVLGASLPAQFGPPIFPAMATLFFSMVQRAYKSSPRLSSQL
jgi:hypothetical protein